MSRGENAESPVKIFMGFDVKKKIKNFFGRFLFRIRGKKKKNMDADVFRNMYDDVSKIVDEHGAEAVTMKVLRNRLEDLYDTDLTSEDLALLDQMIQKKFNDPETQRVLAERINTPERTLVVNAGGGSTALKVPPEATGMAEEHEAPVAQQVVLPVATAAPVPNANWVWLTASASSDRALKLRTG